MLIPGLRCLKLKALKWLTLLQSVWAVSMQTHTLLQTKAYTIHQSTNRYFHQSGIILPKWLPCLPVPALALPHCGYTGLCQRPPFNSHVNSGQSHILWILKLSPRFLKWFRQKYVRGTSQFSTKASSTKLLSSLTKSIWPPLPKSWSATLIEKLSAVDARRISHFYNLYFYISQSW